MVSHLNSNAEDEGFEFTLSWSQPSGDNFDEGVTQLHDKGSTSTDNGACLTASSSEEEPALAVSLSQLSVDAFDEQVAQFHNKGSSSTDDGVRPTTSPTNEEDVTAPAPSSSSPQLLPTPIDEQTARLFLSLSALADYVKTSTNESDQDRLQLGMYLYREAAEIINQQVAECNRRQKARAAGVEVESALLPVLAAHHRLEEIFKDLEHLWDRSLANNPTESASHDNFHILNLLGQGTSLLQRYQNSGMLDDLDEGINTFSRVLEFLPDDHPKKAAIAAAGLSGLGSSLQVRFEHLGELADLERAIKAKKQALDVSPNDHPVRALHLSDLGSSLESRFKRLGELADIDMAITVQQQAVSSASDDDQIKAACLNGLGNSFATRFEHLSEPTNLDSAIKAHQQAVNITCDDASEKSIYLCNLGFSLTARYKHRGDLTDLDTALPLLQQAISVVRNSRSHSEARCLSNLASCLGNRFDRLGHLIDLDTTITALQRAVDITADNHAGKAERLSYLGGVLRVRCQHLGDLAGLDAVITLQQQAVSLIAANHPDIARHLHNLGTTLLTRFEHFGELSDIDAAIVAYQQSVNATPDNNFNKARRLHHLGRSFWERFRRLGELSDLDASITIQQQCVTATPDSHPFRCVHLHGLGLSFSSRFEHLGELTDLDMAITIQQQAISLIPDDHPFRADCLLSLGVDYHRRFRVFGELTDIDMAITVEQQAVDLTPDNHPNKAICLGDLGFAHARRFDHLGGLADLEIAIAFQKWAVNITPNNHLNRALMLDHLGDSLLSRHRYEPDEATLKQAITTYAQSAASLSSPPSTRLSAARNWADLCLVSHSSETIDAYSTLIGLLPRVVWLGRTVEQRYKDISNIGDTVAGATAAAIYFGQYNLALEWLEQGRSIVWGQILQLRTPLDELRLHHPNEADELQKLSHALETAGAVENRNGPNSTNRAASLSLEAAAQAHRRLAEDYDRILGLIRSLPGFSEFLQPEKFTSLCSTATSGCIIVVNTHQLSCDALILVPQSSQVSHVALPGLQVSELSELQLRLAGLTRGVRHFALYDDDESPAQLAWDAGLSYILEQLWLHIAEPVLRYLKLLQIPAAGRMPHVTWCLTGLLSFLPIHAAGLYGAMEQPKIFDYVVSSYTPTLTALLSTKRHSTESNSSARLLTVSQPATPGQLPLPGTVREVDAIQTLQNRTAQLHITRLDNQEATVATVTQSMKACSWIHLACHGAQDSASPTDSAFLLFDGPLSLKEIMKQSFSHTELAFLSACQTAKGDSKLPEESIHLATGMLMAGYRSVVGTMWSIQDYDAPIIAEKFYEYLIDEAGGDSTRAAYALHDAVAHLRKTKGEKCFASWVPFIHLGICSPSFTSAS